MRACDPCIRSLDQAAPRQPMATLRPVRRRRCVHPPSSPPSYASPYVTPKGRKGDLHARGAVSIASQLDPAWPGVSVLRLLRILKVFRIFARLGSLRMLAESLLASLLPVGNALFVLLLVSAVYAVLGVQLFQGDIPESFSTFSSAFLTVGAGKESGRALGRGGQGMSSYRWSPTGGVGCAHARTGDSVQGQGGRGARMPARSDSDPPPAGTPR